MMARLTFNSLIILLVLICNSIFAQQTEKEELAKLSFLMGNWSGSSYSYKGSDTTRVWVEESVNYIMGGDIMTIDVRSPNLTLHTLVTYNVKEQCYYYHPFRKTGGGAYKGQLIDKKFLVQFSPERRLIFEKTENGEFHEYGEILSNGKWSKYFEDILSPAPLTNDHPSRREKITKKYIDPTTAYTNVITVDHESYKTIYVAGQVGSGDTKEEQFESAYKAIEKRLTQAGASFSDMVEMKIYIADYDPDIDLSTFFKVRERLYGDLKMPPNAFIGVSSLYNREKKVEMSGTAIVIK